MAVGRPSKFTQRITDEICTRLAEGEPLTKICLSRSMPSRRTVHTWLLKHEGFLHSYSIAKDLQADCLAEEILKIADDESGDMYTNGDGESVPNTAKVRRSQLRVNARQWYVAKIAPKKYGERITNEMVGPNGGPVQVQIYVPSNGRD